MFSYIIDIIATNRRCVFLLALLLGVAGGMQAQEQKELHPELQKLVKPHSDASFLYFKPSTQLKAHDFLNNYLSALGLKSQDEIRILKAESDELGFIHHSAQQYYRNIPVEFAELKIHEKGGRIQTVNGRVVTDISVDTNPALSEEEALARALGHVGADKYAWEVDYLEQLYQEKQKNPNATLYPEGQLAITSPLGVSDEDGKNYVLAWKFAVYDASLDKAQMVYVHADNGQVVNSYPLTYSNCVNGAHGKAETSNQKPETARNPLTTPLSCTSATGTTTFYGDRTIYTSKPSGSTLFILDANCAGTSNVRIHTRKFVLGIPDEVRDLDNIWGDDVLSQQTAVTAHWGVATALDYFKSVHARNSYDNNGGAIDIFTQATFYYEGNPYGNNASWAFPAGIMSIGWGNKQNIDTPEDDNAPLDIVGHELAHGVTDASAGLVGQGESGALNESFSDIFGAHLEFWAIGGDWLIGEDNQTGYDRNMANPKEKNDPNAYKGENWISTSAQWDDGGVHTNTGVQNKWFHLLSVGGSGRIDDYSDKYNVKGIGISSAARIAYRSLTQYLSSGSDYSDARSAAIQAAEDLFGQCSDEVISTTNAWYAVGVGFPALMIDSLATEKTACDMDDGKAFIKVKSLGLVGTAQYQWSDPMMQTTQQATGLAAGPISVTVTDDGNNCTVDTTLMVTEDANFSLEVQKMNESKCGEYDGWARVKLPPINGTPEIHWDTGDNSEMITDLNAGEYSVTVTDTSTMCTLDTLVEITVDNPLSVIITGGGDRTFCQGDNDREIELRAFAPNCKDCIFEWSVPPDYDQIISPSIMVSEPGYYYLKAEQPEPLCLEFAETEVRIWERDCQLCNLTDSPVAGTLGGLVGNLINLGVCTGCLCDEWSIDRIQAVDPNDITGPSGYAEGKWVSANARLGYTIRFENDPDFATAPAQVVRISSPLDSNLNLNSFRLGNFGFGDFTFTVPPNTPFYQQRLDLQDSLGIFVDVTAGIDVAKKEAFWIFESIDPQTNLPPADALAGFLPVNDSLSQQGEGFVNYTIVPKNSLVTGDSVQAQAAIVFDLNAPLGTNTWKNYVDAGAPVSTLVPLPANSDTTAIFLEWSGTDDTTAVGVSHYELYVSRDGGDFELYQGNIEATALEFTGYEGSEYAFFVRAVDNVGNAEPLKGVGEDTVSIKKGLLVSPILYLQGAYDAASGLMRDNLRSAGVLPLTEPYTGLGYTHAGGGGEEAAPQSAFEVSTADAIVDWVFLELRHKNDSSFVVATRSALLQRDGDVVDVDGVSPVTFANAIEDAYYLVVKHRNHLGVMSAAPVALSKTATIADFTADVNSTFGGINGIATLADGNLGLYSGDFNRNGQVQNTDYAAMVLTLGVAGYVQGDLDLNGQVQNTDVQFSLVPNIGRGQAIP